MVETILFIVVVLVVGWLLFDIGDWNKPRKW